MKSIFDANFYFQFTPTNPKELQSLLDKIITPENDDPHAWSANCLVETISLNAENWIHHIGPSLDIFSKHFNYSGRYEVSNPWINLYSKNGFQEIHDHHDCDMSAVFLLNDGIDFARLYFYDRLSGVLNKSVRELIGYNSYYYPELKAGDFIIFPSSTLHGVSPHKSKEIRKTFAFNFNLLK